jgi:hypothetical protein
MKAPFLFVVIFVAASCMGEAPTENQAPDPQHEGKIRLPIPARQCDYQRRCGRGIERCRRRAWHLLNARATELKSTNGPRSMRRGKDLWDDWRPIFLRSNNKTWIGKKTAWDLRFVEEISVWCSLHALIRTTSTPYRRNNNKLVACTSIGTIYIVSPCS